MQCCPLLPVCLLVSSVESGLTEVFAVGLLLAALAVGFWTVINDISTCLCWSAGAAVAVAFVVWIWHAALLGSIGNGFSYVIVSDIAIFVLKRDVKLQLTK